ncbi:MAG: ATP-binding cassette domain-containing protein [Candidatus Lokiarchaeota archaeon]|nr:ATP-binding cassette domain-containing protein [Candidatus Lokiarchaeota archaeon]
MKYVQNARLENNDSPKKSLLHRVSHQEKNNPKDVLISINHVSKKFCRNLKRSMAYGIADLTKNLLGLKPNTTMLRQAEFWALDDVSFELKRGESLGIIGVNGSGKTTLLRLLTGIFPPDKGELAVKGRVGSLVAVGAGFHPHMTGKENVYLNGTILGMSKTEIQTKFQNIIDFAEIGDFLDAPVSTYSSGMRVRLGFSIALHCVPDILLVDEILSVGDLGFRNKSLRRMREFREQANALIFVSHNLEQVRILCNRVIILDKGRVVFDGTTYEGCTQYQEMTREIRLDGMKTDQVQLTDEKLKVRYSSQDEIDLIDFGIMTPQHQKTNKIAMDESLLIFCDFIVKKDIEQIYFSAGVLDEEQHVCIHVVSNDDDKMQFPTMYKGSYRILVQIPQHHLMPGIYIPQISIRNDRTGETYERIWSNCSFQVTTDGRTLERGIIAVQENWKLNKID